MKKIVFITAMLIFGFGSCKKDKYSGPQFGTVTDVEGNVYKTVKIGDQWWMAENLKVTMLNDKTPIPMVFSYQTWSDPNIISPMLCYYNNDYANIATFGMLYNWHAVNTGKLAPTGWHVPTDSDWQKLQNYLIANGYNYDGTKTGNKIAKSLAATSGWENDQTEGNVGNNQTANNKSGFNAFPAGCRNDTEDYAFSGIFSFWWNSTGSNNATGIQFNTNELILSTAAPRFGLSVRCVKD
jgi:uncharacterized protein (TIGR02145 family)